MGIELKRSDSQKNSKEVDTPEDTYWSTAYGSCFRVYLVSLNDGDLLLNCIRKDGGVAKFP